MTDTDAEPWHTLTVQPVQMGSGQALSPSGHCATACFTGPGCLTWQNYLAESLELEAGEYRVRARCTPEGGIAFDVEPAVHAN